MKLRNARCIGLPIEARLVDTLKNGEILRDSDNFISTDDTMLYESSSTRGGVRFQEAIGKGGVHTLNTRTLEWQ
ncbi:hypothetical protein T10_6714 [Trichinella papuae]|uniref:Uncharacterized protein n=1 Tax=Trichinella papuae TaxID=268474 RepID=A0A0V1MNY8_9BILA|nr:hypothetical protein T10_6714 [Trichinella papuae]